MKIWELIMDDDAKIAWHNSDDLRLLEICRPLVRNALNSSEQMILSIERSKPTPAHLDPKRYLAILNDEANRYRATLDAIEAVLQATAP
jgi:hypothetical protein